MQRHRAAFVFRVVGGPPPGEREPTTRAPDGIDFVRVASPWQ
jgi:hypothetical protein